jgi:hypothetical protein
VTPLLWSVALFGALGVLILVVALVTLQREVDTMYDCVMALCRERARHDRALAELRADLAHLRAHVARRGLEALNDDETGPSLFD